MQMEMLSDQEKVIEWATLCSNHGWMSEKDFDVFFNQMMVRFTQHGSAVPLGPFAFLVTSKEKAQKIVETSDVKKIAQLVLQTLCGILQFNDITTEYVFWVDMQRKMIEEFAVEMPEEIIPYYVIKDTFNVEKRLRGDVE